MSIARARNGEWFVCNKPEGPMYKTVHIYKRSMHRDRVSSVWLVKPHNVNGGRIEVGKVCLPGFMVGKRIRLRIEIVPDDAPEIIPDKVSV